jgi:RNAse (barnase) inhibitor barstar
MSKARYQIDGTQFSTLEGFYEQVSAVLMPNATWGKNLDAFNDILRGGFGTPEDGFILEWKNSGISQAYLGYSETVRQLKNRLDSCHPQNRANVSHQLKSAENQEGPTVFDWLIEIISRHGDQGDESKDGVELVLL